MSIMIVALLGIGAFLFWQGKVNFGSVQTEGRHVKAAGAVLMLPAAGFVLLSFIFSVLFRSSSSSSQFVSALLNFFQLVMMVIAVVVAYILIADPPNAPHLPGILGQIQNERRNKPSQPPSSKPKQQQRPAPRHPLESFIPTRSQPIKVSNVMSVTEAAAYMGVHPDEIMRLIDAGKLPAARDSGGFRIARSVLDELKETMRA
ncbi:MAG: helix-turn-helix domain-containing protein [Anaerolineaceae bacterium]|nr:helix-turn-helix domain-containing protein [Anaerolineaceae bacterium]